MPRHGAVSPDGHHDPRDRRQLHADGPTLVGAPSIGAHVLQNAIDGAGPGDLLVLHKGQYQENVIINKRLMLQGSGPGGIITSETTNVADVPVAGTTINGRYCEPERAALAGQARHDELGGQPGRRRGRRASPCVAPSTGGDRFSTGTTNARIDGIGLITSQGLGAGGLQVNAYATQPADHQRPDRGQRRRLRRRHRAGHAVRERGPQPQRGTSGSSTTASRATARAPRRAASASSTEPTTTRSPTARSARTSRSSTAAASRTTAAARAASSPATRSSGTRRPTRRAAPAAACRSRARSPTAVASAPARARSRSSAT